VVTVVPVLHIFAVKNIFRKVVPMVETEEEEVMSLCVEMLMNGHFSHFVTLVTSKQNGVKTVEKIN
jgi:hypothetical protein